MNVHLYIKHCGVIQLSEELPLRTVDKLYCILFPARRFAELSTNLCNVSYQPSILSNDFIQHLEDKLTKLIFF